MTVRAALFRCAELARFCAREPVHRFSVRRTVRSTLRRKHRVFLWLFAFIAPSIRESRYLAAAYGYMRHLDDLVDDPNIPPVSARRILDDQLNKVRRLYAGDELETNESFERLLCEFIKYDRAHQCVLREPFMEMLGSLRYDLDRIGRVLTHAEFAAYTECMASSFCSFLLHFLAYRHGGTRELIRVASAACQAYMLRDLKEDLDRGYINVDRESIESFKLDLHRLDTQNFRNWLQVRIAALEQELGLIRVTLRQARRVRDRLILLLFVVPRMQALKMIRRNGYCPLNTQRLALSDYIEICMGLVPPLLGR